jgi:hypothetical protein
VNAPRVDSPLRRFRPRLALVLALATAAIVSGAAVQSVGATRAATSTFVSSDLGYQVDLPANFRRSILYSYVADAADPFYVGQDVLTPHAIAAEAADKAKVPGATWHWVVTVRVLKNPAGLTPLQFLNRLEWASTQTTQNLTFAGSSATLVRFGAVYPFTYYIAHGNRMFMVSYSSDSTRPVSGVSETDLTTIINSFKFTR